MQCLSPNIVVTTGNVFAGCVNPRAPTTRARLGATPPFTPLQWNHECI
ncbi:hypothetical protein BPSOL_1252 [Bifidobacterium pseudolongum]|nr:hypothetical protein BPSOL_1252 [Bifidobacterium pseudolongum]